MKEAGASGAAIIVAGMDIDERFIQRTFDLAGLGMGAVSPNPLVGCVVVREGKVIGEGWHRRYGEAHAEVNAINSVEDKSLLSESTVYVNLEPCAHFGKTPPCADLLVRSGVKKVVIANVDPNPLVGGKGIQRLEDAGIEVTAGVLEREGWELNKRFFTALHEKRPYVILKWAQTSDGFIARSNYDSKWISNAMSRRIVHKWRAEEDAIMVGTKTAGHDNPKLNVRDWSGRNPVRVVIDKYLKLEKRLHLFDRSQLTLCYNLKSEKAEENLSYIKLDENNFLEALLQDLYQRDLHSVIIEGGALLLHSIIEAELWDEARIFISPQEFEKGIAAPKLGGLSGEEVIDTDKLLIYKNKKWLKN